MTNALAIFAPNRNLSRSTALLLASIQAAAFVLLWFLSPTAFVPTPMEILNALGRLFRAGLGQELITSFLLNLEAILISAVVSLLLAYSTAIPFFRPVVSFICKLRFLSLAGLTFFFTLATANGHQLKLALLVFGISVFFVTSMVDVIEAIPRVQFDLARTLRMGELRVIWEVVVLGQADKVFDVLRQNAAIGWMMLTMVEGMSRSDGGVGPMLLNQNKQFHLDAVLAVQIVILLVGLGQDYMIGLLKNKVFCPYAMINTERK